MPTCVAGMHRSGTSMLAHMLNQCGLHLGAKEDLIPATADNPDGHWEHREFVRLNDELLNHHGGGWDNPPTLERGWEQAEALSGLRSDAANLVSQFDKHNYWGWKDPRSSLTFGFWRGLVPNLKLVISLRNPLDVASSLRRRGLSSYSFGLALWQVYNERILAESSRATRIIVHYDSLLTDDPTEIRRVTDFLGLRATDIQVQRACATAKSAMRHSKFTVNDLAQSGVSTAIIELYLRLCEETAQSKSRETDLVETLSKQSIVESINVSSRNSAVPFETYSEGFFPEADHLRPLPSPLNYQVIAMKELKSRPQAARSEQRATETNVNELKESLLRMREQLKAVQEDNRLRDLQLQQQSQLLTELQESWNHYQYEYQKEIYDLSSQLKLAQSNGSDLSNQICYQQMIRRLREVVRTHLPSNSRSLVISRGDDDLLKLYGRRAAHFPQLKNGTYSGYYPKSGLAATAHLETLRADGYEYLVIPQTSLWWLEKYTEFRRHLDVHYRLVFHDQDTAAIYSLKECSELHQLNIALAECRIRVQREPVVLNWNSGMDLVTWFSTATVFSPPDPDETTLPYLDKSIDVVCVSASAMELLNEARRVAVHAVFIVDSQSECRVEWLSKPSTQLPSVSIVIAVHNQATVTEACLKSLVETLPESFRGEIIVVDDASTDSTPELLKRWEDQDHRFRWIRNETNQGFLSSASRGAASADGDIILFLNNDVVLLPDWLPPMLTVFRDFPLAGAVGGKLLFSDGVLQEAGGMVFCDASAANFGRGDHDLEASQYNVVREVDYCSGAFLATRRTLFEKIGGFDIRYRPAYYEDTDYCFAVRQNGYRVYYQPESSIVHLEGVSSGTDLSKGVKQYQVVNQAKFAEKWASVLVGQPQRPAEGDRPAWNELAQFRIAKLGGRQ